MKESNERVLTLEHKHTGERLTLRRVKASSGIEEVHLTGSLPARRQGPPLHIHFGEDEQVEVISGTLSASVDGKDILVEAGGTARFGKGSAHRWWNDGEQELLLRGVATPAVDLDRYLQGLFEVLNAGPSMRPPLFYMAHVLYRHRHTQLALVMPRVAQRVLLPLVVLLGSVLGKYRGTDWPGCPSRCTGAPLGVDSDSLSQPGRS